MLRDVQYGGADVQLKSQAEQVAIVASGRVNISLAKTRAS
jgi:hypothetical protein